MGERKVLNKYYPPDFDHRLLKKNRRPKDKQDVVRMMLPMTIRCNTCGNYLYIGTKYNMRKETAQGENYLGIKIYRFYFRCSVCYAELTFKTDPKNHDYVVEHGGSRNYEPWRDAQAAESMLREIRQTEEEGNTMKSLEYKTYDSKRELQILDALDELKELNKRKAMVPVDKLLEEVVLRNEKQEQEDEKADREIARLVFKEKTLKRLIDIDIEEEETTASLKSSTTLDKETKNLNQSSDESSRQKQGSGLGLVGSGISPQKGIKPIIKAKKVFKEEDNGVQKNAFSSSTQPLHDEMKGLTIEENSANKPSNKMASLLNYSDDD